MSFWRSSLKILLPLLCSSALMAEELLIYTAVEPKWFPVYIEAFQKAEPNVKISVVRASTGTLVSRLVAEQNNPQADVILGVSAIAIENLRVRGLLEAYTPKNIEAINPKMQSKDKLWVGMNAWGGSICINTEVLKRKNLPIPTSWKDLINPIYKGQIVMPSPQASGTGYMFFLGWLQGFGEENGWKYFDELHKNILFYSSSGSRPAAMVAQGEIPIGLSSAAFMAPFTQYDIPVITVEPTDGIAWDCEANALPKGSRHPEIAKRFLDFCTSESVAKIAADFSGIAAISEYSTPEGQKIASNFLAIDFEKASAEKKAIIAKWKGKVTQ